MNFDLVNYENYIDTNNFYYTEENLKKSVTKNDLINIKDREIIRMVHTFIIFYFFFNYINKSIL